MRTEADAKDILAYLTGRNEEEVIIHPDNLKNIERVYPRKPKP